MGFPVLRRGAHGRIIAGGMANLPTNADVAAQFELLADIFELEDVQSFRVLAYRRAATRIRETGTSVAQMALDGKAKGSRASARRSRRRSCRSSRTARCTR